MGQQNIRVKLDLADNLPPVRLIAHQLQNIFLSLLQDHLATALPGSSLEIRTALGQFDYVAITITGVPAPSETGADSDPFDPMATASREARLALGLAISREIIIEHGGSLETTGEGGQTFSISLPLA